MSARDAMSKMLDQLMGQNRDGDENERQKHFTDREVCRPFLLGICVNELFINTREERGDCTKVHSITLKEEFEKASLKRDYRFEEEVLEYLKSFIRDNERKIEANKRRLESVEDDPELEKLSSEIHEVAVQIGELVAKAENLGNEGNIDESLAMLKDAEEIKGKKKRLEDEYHAKMPRHAQQQQKLKACEVCGAFLSMYDNDRRLADHFGGKLHMGFVSIREKIAMLEEVIQEKAERRRKEREEIESERKKRRSRSSSRERYHDRDRDRHRDREKHRRHRSRSRERDRDRRHRHRSRSRERRSRERRRSRSRDRHRSRSRDRRRSRSKERRRSRSKDRHRSRSKDRHRSRSKERHRSRSRERNRKRSR